MENHRAGTVFKSLPLNPDIPLWLFSHLIEHLARNEIWQVQDTFKHAICNVTLTANRAVVEPFPVGNYANHYLCRAPNVEVGFTVAAIPNDTENL